MDKPQRCGYKSTECENGFAAYETKLTSAVTWKGVCCQKCFIAMQKVIYCNNTGTLEYRFFNTDDWKIFESRNDPTHAGRNDHLA